MNSLTHKTTISVLAVALTACGDDDPQSPGPNGPDAGSRDATAPVDGGGPTDAGMPALSRYAMMIRIRQPDGTTNATYLKTVETLDPDTTLTTEGAREFTAQLRFSRYRSSVFIENVRLPTLARFDYDPSTGMLAEGPPAISFMPRGLSSVRTIFLRPDKAYALDGSATTIAIFDPTALELRPGTIDISSARPMGLDLDLVQTVTRGNRTFMTLAFADLSNPANPRIEPAIIVAVIDNENDRLLNILRDERCGHASGIVLAETGDIYVHGDNGYNVIDRTKRSCILRIPSGSETFDDYVWRPAMALGGRESSRLHGAGGTRAVVYALYPERVDPANPLSIVLDPVRRPWIVDMDTQTATVVDGTPFTRTGIEYEVDGALWIGLSEGFTSTDLYSIDADTGTARLEATSEGQVFSVTRFP